MSIYLSASSIADFIKCPRKVYYRLSKTALPDKSADTIIGEVVHEVLEKEWNDRTKARKLTEKLSKKSGLLVADATKADSYVDNYFLHYSSLLTPNDSIEFNFKLPLYDDVFIVGKMDRVSNGNIFDWKTGVIRSTRLDKDVQCIIYSWAYESIHGVAPANVYIAPLRTGGLIKYYENQLHVAELFELIIPRMIKTIKSGSFERLGMFNSSCFRCYFKGTCLPKGDFEDVMDSSISPE